MGLRTTLQTVYDVNLSPEGQETIAYWQCEGNASLKSHRKALSEIITYYLTCEEDDLPDEMAGWIQNLAFLSTYLKTLEKP